MDFDDIHLHERKDGCLAVGDEILAQLGPLLDADAAQGIGRPDLGMLHEVALPADGAGAAHQCQGPPAQMRQFPLRDSVVVPRQVELGEADVGKHHPLGMAERHSCHEAALGGHGLVI